VSDGSARDRRSEVCARFQAGIDCGIEERGAAPPPTCRIENLRARVTPSSRDTREEA